MKHPLAIAVRADSPFQSLEDIVKASKAEPGKYSWTWVGTGGNTQFAAYVFYKAAGMDADKEVVPCITKSDGDSVVNLLGGTADICIAQTNAFPEFVKSGEVRVLGHSGVGSMDIGGKEVKSWTDLGYKGTYNLRCFVFAPKDLPEEVSVRYTEVFKKIVESNEFADSMLKDGFTPQYLGEKEAVEAFKVEAESAMETAKLVVKK
jgi:tripartite-type tricarboxylate transporter receptor subunit TctC